MKKRSKLMIGLSALLLATAGIAATGTYAWFTATATPTAKTANAKGTLGTTNTTLDQNGYVINLTITPAGDVELTNLSGSKLYRGAYYGAGDVRTEELTSTTDDNCIKAFSITATWASAPSAAEDIAYFKNKRLSGGVFTAKGQAKLAASATYTSGSYSDQDSGTFYIDISDTDSLTLTPVIQTNGFFRIQTNNASGEETAHAANSDYIDIAENLTLSVGSKS